MDEKSSRAGRINNEVKKQLQHMLQDIGDAYGDGEECFRNALADMNRYISMLETDTAEVDRRDMILFGEPYVKDKYESEIRRFSDMDWKKLSKLTDMGIIDLESRQKEASHFMKFYNYLSDHHLLKCYGYVCSPESEDAGGMVSIEGIDYRGYVTMNMLIDFVGAFRDADEFAAGVNRLHCRYVS